MVMAQNSYQRENAVLNSPSEFARFLVPEIRKFYESEEGQRMFAEWQAEQEDK